MRLFGSHFVIGETRGIASCLHVSGNRAFLPFFDGAAAYVRVDEEGYVNIQVGEPEMGQGSRSTFSLIASHELGIPVERVTVGRVDTDVSPHGLGFALSEEMPIAGGKSANDSFASYQVPKAHDMPAVRILFVETDDPNGPYGAKGLAQPAIHRSTQNRLGSCLPSLGVARTPVRSSG